MTFQELKNKMEREGYNASSVADVMQFFANHPIEEELFFGPKSTNKPLSAYIDEALGRPLRDIMALRKEITKDIAIVLHTTNIVTMAQASVQLDRAQGTLADQQLQISNLEAAFREAASSNDEPTQSAPATVYEDMEAVKDFKRQQVRCLW